MRSFPAASLFIFALVSTSLAPALRAQTPEAQTPAPQTITTQSLDARGALEDMPFQMLTTGGGIPSLLPMLRPVAGEPFSASFSSESRQQLPDGSYILKNQSGKIARDNQSRTYDEITRTMGPAQGSRTYTSININDRVAGASFLLNPQNHTARRFVQPSHRAPQPSSEVSSFATPQSYGESATTTPPPPTRTPPAVPRNAASASRPQIDKQDLGTESMEGLIVRHYLETRTIPAGEIGNERELTVSNEVWYSRDLHLNLKQIRKDPRFGEETLTLTLTEVVQGEPPTSLFEIPRDYTVTDSPFGASIATGTAVSNPVAPQQP